MSKRLEAEVWALDNCAGCGLCVSACSKQVLVWGEVDHPELRQPIKTVGYTKNVLDSCTFCEQFCEEVCPRLEHLPPYEARLIKAAKAQGPVLTGEPNGVILGILAAGRSAGLIDGAVMLDFDPWKLEPVVRVASTVEDIVDSLGPQYLWAPVLDSLNQAIFDWGMENLAVVGTPCTAQAIRKLKDSTNPRLKPYQDAVRLVISNFCTGVYKPEMIQEVVIKEMGVPKDAIRRIETTAGHDGIKVILWDKSEKTIGRNKVERFTRSGCGSCDDYLGTSADIAVGYLGAGEEASTLMVYSSVGDVFTRNAIRMNLLEVTDKVDLELLKAAADEKGRRERAQELKDFRVLMLDAMADPLKRGEAIQQFVRLYRTPTRSKPQEAVRNGCTGC
ncbi:Coenzyme F420 hydrogenase/dehydrogenase, beta subunit C-terminal domain [Chloroflexota bacterium]